MRTVLPPVMEGRSTPIPIVENKVHGCLVFPKRHPKMSYDYVVTKRIAAKVSSTRLEETCEVCLTFQQALLGGEKGV